MKFAQRSALLCLVTLSLPLAVACGSNDASGLFSTSGGSSSSLGGSLASAGTSSAHAGQSMGGSVSSTAGSGGGTSVAGQGTSGGNSAGGNGSAGSSAAGAGAGGAAGGAIGGAGGAPAGGAPAGGAHMGGAPAGGAPAGGGGASGGDVGSGGASAGAGGMGVGGSAGTSGAGGGCGLDSPPQDGAVCTDQTPNGCFYAGEACSCLADANGPGRKWSCYGTPDKCPASSPADGASCKTMASALCPYPGGDYCVCTPTTLGGGGGTDPKWMCNTDPTPACPGMRPTKGDFCTSVKECAYDDRDCFCNGATWTCE
jgi:hypothetical protein